MGTKLRHRRVCRFPTDWRCTYSDYNKQINGLMRERRNSSALAMELHLSCTNPLKYRHAFLGYFRVKILNTSLVITRYFSKSSPKSRCTSNVKIYIWCCVKSPSVNVSTGLASLTSQPLCSCQPPWMVGKYADVIRMFALPGFQFICSIWILYQVRFKVKLSIKIRR